MKKSVWLVLFFTHFLIGSYAQTEQSPELIVQTNHSGFIQSVDFSPNGKLLATGDSLGKIKLWDLQSNRLIITIEAHPGIKFDPDNEMPHWTKSKDMAVNFFERFDGLGYAHCVHSLSFSSDSKYLVSGSSDRTIKVWDLSNLSNLKKGKAEKIFNTQTRIWFVKFNNAGTKILSIGEDNSYRFWDLLSGNEIKNDPSLQDSFQLPWQTSNGKLTAEYNEKEKTIRLIDKITNQTKLLEGHEAGVRRAVFSPDGKFLASCGWDRTVRLWDVTGKTPPVILGEHSSFVSSLSFSSDGKTLASVGGDLSIKLWDVKNQKISNTINGYGKVVIPYYFALDDKILIASSENRVFIWDLEKGMKSQEFKVHTGRVDNTVFNESKGLIAVSADSTFPLQILIAGIARYLRKEKELRVKDGTILTADNFIKMKSPDDLGEFDKSFDSHNSISIWNLNTNETKTLTGPTNYIDRLVFSNDGNILVSGDRDGFIRLWDLSNESRNAVAQAYSDDDVFALAISNDGKRLATINTKNKLKLWKISDNDKKIDLIPDSEEITINMSSARWLGFSVNDKTLSILGRDDSNKISSQLYDAKTGAQIEFKPKTFEFDVYELQRAVAELYQVAVTRNRRFEIRSDEIGKLALYDSKNKTLLAWLVSFSEDRWAVVMPSGRFDTNIIENPEGMHWILPDSPFNPRSLEIFTRQYYEPKLLPRLLKCTEENTCGKEFKPLPSIAEINQIQPGVTIKEIKPVPNSTDLANVTIKVENVTGEVSLSNADKTNKKQLSSGVYDLRLFRDEQLVDGSTPKNKLEKFIADAPRLVEATKASGKLIDTPEDKAWRETNDIFKLKGENIKQISPNKIEYTFRNIKLPRDGRKEVEFTAYAFNADRVKSATTEPFKFNIPNQAANVPQKGRVYLISIGVNASENPAYNLKYAANDARKMQEIVGARLKVDSKYSDVVRIPLISDYADDGKFTENNAQKAIIKGVFSLLAGNEKEVSQDILKQIPNRKQIRAIEPEDTLIITYSGHGYTDQAGIFYLLPSDIGKAAPALTPEVLSKTISSDELSLWMENITAKEMIMIIDACYSSAAVQGDGFKPGPMGSRGLGQLAYDKDMKILSATQANNVALELGCLQEGLLSYALLEDGINKSLADTDKDKQILSTEWLSYAEKRVPELYQEGKAGKCGVLKDGKLVTGNKGHEIVYPNNVKSNLNLQQPSLFDFKRRNQPNVLFYLP